MTELGRICACHGCNNTHDNVEPFCGYCLRHCMDDAPIIRVLDLPPLNVQIRQKLDRQLAQMDDLYDKSRRNFLVSKRISRIEENASICPICRDIIDRTPETRKLQCRHIYHTTCISRWLETHNRCPMCREVIFDN